MRTAVEQLRQGWGSLTKGEQVFRDIKEVTSCHIEIIQVTVIQCGIGRVSAEKIIVTRAVTQFGPLSLKG